MTRLLESGRVPADRRAAVVQRIVERGDADDMAAALRLITGGEMDAAAQVAVLAEMENATKTRKVKPRGDLSSFNALLRSDDAKVRQAAVPLAGLWDIEEAASGLRDLVADAETPQKLKETALDALMSLDRNAAKDAVLAMVDDSQPAGVRRRGLARLVELDTQRAAAAAAKLLADPEATDDPLPLIQPFLAQQDGPRTLAMAIDRTTLSEDRAKQALSRMSAVGSADPLLTAAILKSANLSGEGRKWEPEKIAEVAAEVASAGDPARGEEIFRRESLNCYKCHQVNKAGGNIGPELSAVGVTSPNDYLIRSLIYPSADIKEAWETKLVMTADGKILSGIVVSEDDDLLKLKDAQGNVIDIPTDDIDAEKPGESLMPSGLTKFLSDAEFIDLVAYLKALGTPDSPYAVRSTPRLQKYEFYNGSGYNLQSSIIAGDKLQKLHNRSGWEPVYAKASGDLPLDEMTARIGGDKVVYLRGEVEVDEPTQAFIALKGGRDGLTLFVNGKLMDEVGRPACELKPGVNRITIRADTAERAKDFLNITLEPADGGSIRPVDGA